MLHISVVEAARGAVVNVVMRLDTASVALSAAIPAFLVSFGQFMLWPVQGVLIAVGTLIALHLAFAFLIYRYGDIGYGRHARRIIEEIKAEANQSLEPTPPSVTSRAFARAAPAGAVAHL